MINQLQNPDSKWNCWRNITCAHLLKWKTLKHRCSAIPNALLRNQITFLDQLMCSAYQLQVIDMNKLKQKSLKITHLKVIDMNNDSMPHTTTYPFLPVTPSFTFLNTHIFSHGMCTKSTPEQFTLLQALCKCSNTIQQCKLSDNKMHGTSVTFHVKRISSRLLLRLQFYRILIQATTVEQN